MLCRITTKTSRIYWKNSIRVVKIYVSCHYVTLTLKRNIHWYIQQGLNSQRGSSEKLGVLLGGEARLVGCGHAGEPAHLK